MTTLRHRAELDGLRGVAILIVLASHTHVPGFAYEGGLAGVTLFFVLSGYLITSLLVIEHARDGKVDLRAFYLRRALRLLPALYALLLVVAIGYSFHAWSLPTLGSLPIAVVAVTGYVANWVSISSPLGVLGHTWSLAIEEQFYLLWPVTLLAGLRVLGPRRLAYIAILVAAFVVPWRIIVLEGYNYGRVFNGTDVHADALLLGCAAALLGLRLPSAIGWAATAGTVILGMAWVTGGLGQMAFLPVAAVLSLAAVAGCPAAFGWRPLAYVGRISYGLYLWHFLFVWWGWPFTLSIGVSLAVATASYRWLEQPFLRLKSRFSPADRSGVASASPAAV